MIIFGTRSRHIASKEISATCNSCGEQKMFFHVYGSYAHVMWIPSIPFGKEIFSWCGHCQNYLKLKQMPEDLRRKAKEFRSASSYPKWFYSGIGIVALLVAYFMINNHLAKSQLPKYVNTPEAGDIYYVEESPGEFTSFKVNRINSDSLYVHWNTLYVNKSYNVSDIDKVKNYSDKVYGISRVRIDEEFEKGTIIKIKR